MVEKTICFRLDEDIIFKFKQKALDERTTQKELLTKWIKENLNIDD